ncbi:MAG: YebC/PmpR family DNA-binding transcriptional regulator [Planctomycetes bacterium]|nr:YebC/PmpR family DNA-binding transcriptional regulator [Planctomycetota bacterium]
MSGHSRWANIKHSKAAVDKKRGSLWTKLARRVMIAARTGGGDPEMNLGLGYAVDKARAANMPKDTIDRAIKRGTGELEGEQLEAVTYEGYGPGGVAFYLEALTDNRNRTAPEVRKIFERHGGKLGVSGSVARMFERRGVIAIPRTAVDEDRLLELALELGAEDVATGTDSYEVSTAVPAFDTVRRALESRGLPLESADLLMVARDTVPVENEGVARKVLALVDEFEEHDDIQGVHSNFDIPDAVLEKVSAAG